MRYDFDYYTNHEVLKKHNQINRKLSDENVLAVCINPDNNKFYIVEGCDDYFEHELTKDDCLALADLFNDLANIL